MIMVIPCRLEQLGVASAAVRAVADRHLDASDGALVESAVTEVCSNIIRHGHPGDADHEFTIAADGAGDSIAIEIRDEGPAFSFDVRPLPDVDVPLEDLPEGGFGMALVRQMMNVVEYSRVDGVNIIRLVKQASATPVAGQNVRSVDGGR